MIILKHQKSGRLFEATPALLKNKHMQPASTEEAEAFLGTLSEKQKEKIEKQFEGLGKAVLPENFDLNIDISTFGKVELMEVGKRLNVQFPSNVRVKQLKDLVQSALDELRAKAEAEEDPEAEGGE